MRTIDAADSDGPGAPPTSAGSPATHYGPLCSLRGHARAGYPPTDTGRHHRKYGDNSLHRPPPLIRMFAKWGCEIPDSCAVAAGVGRRTDFRRLGVIPIGGGHPAGRHLVADRDRPAMISPESLRAVCLMMTSLLPAGQDRRRDHGDPLPPQHRGRPACYRVPRPRPSCRRCCAGIWRPRAVFGTLTGPNFRQGWPLRRGRQR